MTTQQAARRRRGRAIRKSRRLGLRPRPTNPLDALRRAASWDGAREETPDIDERRNPWLRTRPAPPLEYVGATNESGLAQVSSGPFNVRDKEKFPRATAPEALRVATALAGSNFGNRSSMSAGSRSSRAAAQRSASSG